MSVEIAVSGDSIINRRVSVCQKEQVRELLDIFTDVDVAFTHCEVLIHDYEGDKTYPAAEAGGTWMRAPPFVAEEFKKMGFNAVSLASNHALDYSYGGLYSTWDALDQAEISHAGTGTNLADASSPSYREVNGARVALVSMTSSFADWSRAGEARRDLQGRPGVNPLRYYNVVSSETRELMTDIAEKRGWWVSQQGNEWLLNAPGTHHSLDRLIESDEESEEGPMKTIIDSNDRKRNLRAIEDASAQADIVLVHTHTHAWDPAENLSAPADFLPPFTRDCIEAGADIVVSQGSHAPLRGIEIHEGRPIFYDPGDLFMMSDTTAKLPHDFYERYGSNLDTPAAHALPSEGFAARGLNQQVASDEDGRDDHVDYGGVVHSPPGGYFATPVNGNIVPVIEFDNEYRLENITLNPGELLERPTVYSGVPRRAKGDRAEEILEYVASISEQYGTDINVDGDTGYVTL